LVNPIADIAVIGGSGLYALLDAAVMHKVDTPYGEPSDPITVADVGGRRVAFLPRHGVDHRFPPHRIPYRANLWALRAFGVRQILAPCAVGGLRPELGPGTFVVPDQLIDRTTSRVQTYYDVGAVHVNFADPYCPTGRAAALAAAFGHGIAATDGGAMVVIEGPRFSTRAESRWFIQHNLGDSSALAGDSFPQVNLYTGYLFPRRRGELTLGVLNLTGEDYRLNPLNPYSELPRERLFYLRLKVNL
jgi:5'-methylthioadenosine phosphorylase